MTGNTKEKRKKVLWSFLADMTLTLRDSRHYGYLMIKCISYLNKEGNEMMCRTKAFASFPEYACLVKLKKMVWHQIDGKMVPVRPRLLTCNINKHGSEHLICP